MRVKRIMAVLLTTLMLFGSVFTNVSIASQSSTDPNYIIPIPSASDSYLVAPTPATRVPTITPDTKPDSKGEVYLTVDKTLAAVGEIITATLNIRNFEVVAGYQANIKYDPAVLTPVFSDGTPYDRTSFPEYGTLLQKRYNAIDLAANDLAKGILSFGREYMSMDLYRNSGAAENTGSIAVIKFKVLKNTPTQIKLEDSPVLTNAVNGTMVFDWYAKQLSNYIVTQAPEINSTVVTPTPSNKAEVYMTVDKINAPVDDIITAILNVKGFNGIAGYQVCVKYDPKLLMPVDENGVPYEKITLPGYGTLFNKGNKLSEFASNDLDKGLLNFGRCYFPMNELVASDYGSTGSIAVIRFKVLKNASTAITLVNVPSLTNPIDGTIVFDWDGSQLSNYKVSQAPSINSSIPFNRSELYVTVDKTAASVGDVITATLNVKGFDSIAGCQVCMKYDPLVLMPLYKDYILLEKDSVPEYGTLLQKKYSPVGSALNDLENGYLNFSRVYMNIEKYRNSGDPDKEGTLAVVRFKVLKDVPTKISLVNSPALTNAVDGTMLFDWDGVQLSDYKVTQAPEINSTVVTPTPPNKAEVYMTVDKTTADAGDIIKATLNAKGFSDGISGYQANIKYDPAVLMPIYADGSPYDEMSSAEYGTLLQYRFGPIDVASHDLVNGTLTFGRGYMNMPEYRNSGIIESDGSLAVVRFKVLKAAPVSITMENGPACLDAISGTMIFGRTNLRINDYTVTQAPAINSHLIKPTPTPDVGVKDAGVYLLLDKTNVSVNDIIKATIYADGFEAIAGYQATVKYDPSVLQPVYSDGSSYDSHSAPEYGTLLQKKFNPVDMTLNDLSNGILTFGRTYMNMASYRISGEAENKGSLAVIQFKVLKAAYTKISLENALGFSNTESGTMIFDWNYTQVKGYKVINQPIISVQTPAITPIPTPTITNYFTPPPPTPTAVPTSTPKSSNGEVNLTLDKNIAAVGDIITATVSVKDIACLAAYQVNIKYNPAALQPVYDDGTPYDNKSVPEYGTLLQKRFSPMDIVNNDLKNGILNFGRAYMDLPRYKSTGTAETTGSLAVIRFKVLKAAEPLILFENSPLMSNQTTGTMIFDWNGNQLTGYKVSQAPSINIGTATPMSTPTMIPTPTKTPSKGEVYLTLDKSNAAVGDIIKATVNVKDFKCIAAYQVNIKYDPTMLQPVYSDGTVYDEASVPDYGSLLQQRYSPVDMAANDLNKGILNFGRSYMAMSKYKSSGVPEREGTLAIVGFKVLKAGTTNILLDSGSFEQNAISGTLLFDWDGYQLFGYKVLQAPALNISAPVVTPTPKPNKGTISLTLDRSSAAVGDIIKATVRVSNFDSIAGYQASIKYDPTVLQPVYSDGTAYDNSSVPEYGSLLQKKYAPTDMGANDLKKGILSFGRAYMNLEAYKKSGVPEQSGTVAEIYFKVLKAVPANVIFYKSPSMPDAVEGTMIFDWDGNEIFGYNVVQSRAVIPDALVEMTFDKKSVKVGDMLKATISIDGINNLTGFQFNIRYDQNYIQPWDTQSNSPYKTTTIPDFSSTLTNEKYAPITIAANDIAKGVLNFGKAYMDIASYKADTTSGQSVGITFKVINKIPEDGAKLAWFEHSNTMGNDVNGTLVFAADSKPLTSDDYKVVSPVKIYPDAEQNILIGDVDCNGKVSSDDYAYIRQYLLGMIENFPGGERGWKAADVDGDGNVDSDDYAYMRRWLVGMIDKFPAEEK